MNIWITVLLFLAGLALIVKGGDWFLDGAVWIAESTGVPRFIIGATIVSLATTLPELTVSITGVLEGEVDLAVGNAVGSVTANLGLILGISVVCIPSCINRRQFNLKAVLMVGGGVGLMLLCRGGVLSFLPSLLLFAVFLTYLASNLVDARSGMAESRENRPERRAPVSHRQAVRKLLAFAVGIAAIVAGSRLLIDHGSQLALLLGVPSSIIGVTMVAIGTSLPELVTTLTAIAKKEASMSVGNIIGANVMTLHDFAGVLRGVGGRLTHRRPDHGAGPAGVPAAVLHLCTAAAFQGPFLPLAGDFDAGGIRGLRGAAHYMKGREKARGRNAAHSSLFFWTAGGAGVSKLPDDILYQPGGHPPNRVALPVPQGHLHGAAVPGVVPGNPHELIGEGFRHLRQQVVVPGLRGRGGEKRQRGGKGSPPLLPERGAAWRSPPARQAPIPAAAKNLPDCR